MECDRIYSVLVYDLTGEITFASFSPGVSVPVLLVWQAVKWSNTKCGLASRDWTTWKFQNNNNNYYKNGNGFK